MARAKHPLGIDIGGSGIKGAPVDLDVGEFAADRLRIQTPQESTPDAVADVVASIAEHFEKATGDAPIGVTVPAVVSRGIVRTAANIDQTWIGTDAGELLASRLGRPVTVVNDADAAGVAELHYGAARNVDGLVLLATLGTGIGTALLHRGVLVPNSELGHLQLDGADAETRASSHARETEDLSYEDWAERLQRYFAHIEDLLWPDLIVVGGGVSKHAERYLPLLHLRAPIVPAQLGNAAGIIGAAWLAVNG
ncbi:MAG: ROK family protein [Actinomycetota bacterium]|nr:ROK family protein [Actinomycetota bacterium]